MFIDVRASHPSHVVLGHELSHHIEADNPALYRELLDALDPLLKDHAKYRMMSGMLPGARKDAIKKEMIGDLMGDAFADGQFWRQVGEQNPSLLKRLADVVTRWINDLLNKVRGKPGLGSSAFVTDLTEARRVLADVVARYAGGGSAGTSDIGARFSEQAPTWYSALERGLSAAKQTKATASEWKAIIAKMEGVKKDEVDAVGLNEFLDTQTGQVTREQVLDFVRQNGVQVQEVELGAEPMPKREANQISNAIVDWLTSGERGTDRMSANDAERMAARAAEGRSQAIGDLEVMGAPDRILDALHKSPATKFASYQLPGGENYRELLLTLPVEKIKQTAYEVELGRWATGSGKATYPSKEMAENYAGTVDKPVFSSSHFDEPNILAHVRFNERTDADGKKVLFIEELQSDWAQKGRKEGFRGSPDAAREFFGISKESWATFTPEQKASYAEDMSGRSDAAALIPSAPFVTKTEAWSLLAMKRMIRYASENGFDRIAWDQGLAQAERYDLSKQIDTLHYDPYNKQLSARNGNQQVMKEQGVTPEKIEDFVGKEAVRKLLDTPLNGAGNHELKGADLKVGGEGMSGFYNKIVPSAINKYVKKFGVATQETRLAETASNDKWPIATEVAQGKRPVNSIDITPAMRDAVMQGQPLFSRKMALLQQRRRKMFGLDYTGPASTITKAVVQVLRFDRLTTYLHDVLLKEKLGGLVPEKIKAGVVDRYGVPDEAVDARVMVKINTFKRIREAGTLVEKIATITRDESKILHAIMGSNDKTMIDYLIDRTTPEGRQFIDDAKALISQMTREAVDVGLVSPEVVARNANAYVHRSYKKYTELEAGKTEKSGRARAMRIMGDAYKGRGMRDDVPMDALKLFTGEWWARKLRGAGGRRGAQRRAVHPL